MASGAANQKENHMRMRILTSSILAAAVLVGASTPMAHAATTSPTTAARATAQACGTAHAQTVRPLGVC